MLAATLICLVVGIADGDTLRARCTDSEGYQQIKVRLAGIDAPERRQPFGDVSRQALAKLCFKTEAAITPRSKDRYGRTVADVECRGQDAGQAQVAAGLAWVYVRYSKGYESLYPLEREARDAKRGLWAGPAIAPWEWRGKTGVRRRGNDELSATHP